MRGDRRRGGECWRPAQRDRRKARRFARALKYHIYQSRQRGAEPRVLPVRVGDEARTFVVEVGTARLRFAEGCDPAYVAAVLSAVAKTC